jgi:hypothetical protein
VRVLNLIGWLVFLFLLCGFGSAVAAYLMDLL